MKELHIDLETFSTVDLNKSGVYRYAEDPDFSILLVGISIDDSPVRVYDLAQGEELPQAIVDALLDPAVLKYAHNAAFERVCLSRFLWDQQLLPKGQFLDPVSWRCTMVWSAYAGLPLSLKDVGEALELSEGKMDEGKGLIKLFCSPCKPTAMNGGKERVMPSDAPDKWELFKRYNQRDVEVEMEIAGRLSSIPIPAQVWEEYQDSERINDRGILVDMPLVQSAIRLDVQSQEQLVEGLKELTDLENPRSVQQMKEWLTQNGLSLDTLEKKKVAAILSTAPEPLRTVLRLRQELAKSSVKKYAAMEAAACADGRLRGMFVFYGASRSGRFSGRIVQLQNLYRNSLPDLGDARALVKAGDYEAIDAELYATIMGTEPANLALLDETIKTAIALEIPVEAHLVPMHCNFRQIPDVISKLYAMSVNNVSFLRLVPQGRVFENKGLAKLSADEEKELQQILRSCKETYQDKIRLGLPFSAKRAACGTGTVKLTVRYDGYVFPCEAFKDGMMKIEDGLTPENVKVKSLKEIYNNSVYLQAIRKGLEDYPYCETEEHCYGQYYRKEHHV